MTDEPKKFGPGNHRTLLPGEKHKAVIKRECMAAGLMGEFVVTREELKKKGLDAWDATQEAYRQIKPLIDRQFAMLAASPSGKTIKADVDARENAIASELFTDKPFRFAPKDDVIWVYQHLGASVSIKDAPHSGAYEMLLWARDNKHEFFVNIFKGLLPTKAQIEKEETRSDGDDGVSRLIKEMVASCEDATHSSGAEGTQEESGISSEPD